MIVAFCQQAMLSLACLILKVRTAPLANCVTVTEEGLSIGAVNFILANIYLAKARWIALHHGHLTIALCAIITLKVKFNLYFPKFIDRPYFKTKI